MYDAVHVALHDGGELPLFRLLSNTCSVVYRGHVMVYVFAYGIKSIPHDAGYGCSGNFGARRDM